MTRKEIIENVVKYGMPTADAVVLNNVNGASLASLPVGKKVLSIASYDMDKKQAYDAILKHYGLLVFRNDISDYSDEIRNALLKIKELYEESPIDIVIHYPFVPVFDKADGIAETACIFFTKADTDGDFYIWIDTKEDKLYYFDGVNARLSSIDVSPEADYLANAFVKNMELHACDGKEYISYSEDFRQTMADILIKE